MASFTLTPEFRKQKFYNTFVYKATLKAPGVAFVRRAKAPELIATDIQTAITRRYYGRTKEYWEAVQYDNLKKLWYWIKSNGELRFRYEGDTIGVFANDLKYYKSLEKIFPLKVYEAIAPEEPGIMYFKHDPKFKYRMYFKSGPATPDLVDTISTYMKQVTDNPEVKISGALKDSIETDGFLKSWSWFHGGHCIDFNEERNLSYYHMLFGKSVGKVFKLEKRPA